MFLNEVCFLLCFPFSPKGWENQGLCSLLVLECLTFQVSNLSLSDSSFFL